MVADALAIFVTVAFLAGHVRGHKELPHVFWSVTAMVPTVASEYQREVEAEVRMTPIGTVSLTIRGLLCARHVGLDR